MRFVAILLVIVVVSWNLLSGTLRSKKWSFSPDKPLFWRFFISLKTIHEILIQLRIFENKSRIFLWKLFKKNKNLQEKRWTWEQVIEDLSLPLPYAISKQYKPCKVDRKIKEWVCWNRVTPSGGCQRHVRIEVYQSRG